MPRKKGKIKAVKGETLTIRISPRVKFALELLARKERRSLSSVVEEAVEKVLNDKKTDLSVFVENNDGTSSRRYLPEIAWDPFTPDRIVKLAQLAPDLLTYDEDCIWKVINENQAYFVNEDRSLDLETVRMNWEDIQETADQKRKKFGLK